MKLNITILGRDEWALRLIPLIAVLGAMPLLYRLGMQCIGPASDLLVLTLVWLTDQGIYLSAQGKQILVDVLIAILILPVVVRHLGSHKAASGRLESLCRNSPPLWERDPA